MQTVAIIGAGFSGTMLAFHLLQAGAGPRRIVLIERSGQFGQGIAYGTRCAAHVLNVPAGRMSGVPDDQDHFVRWAKDRNRDIHGGSFLPRMMYGEYLTWTLMEAEKVAAAGVELIKVPGEATAIIPAQGSAEVVLQDQRIQADAIVLALGNFAPADPPLADRSFFTGERSIRDPWQPGRLDAIQPDDPVLLIGTGLTMVDIALELSARGHTGPLHAISRRGLLPQPHRSPAVASHPTPPADLAAWEPTALGMLRALRREVRLGESRGVDWREVVTSIRADTPRLWDSLPLAERRRFMDRLRAFWETHRHRAAPEAAAGVSRLLLSGQLRVLAGRLLSIRIHDGQVEVVVQPRGEDVPRALRVAHVINCTGPETDLRRVANPLVEDLLGRGLLMPDELGLGALTSSDGALIDNQGRTSDRLFACGPLRKGQLWENTAVPELRTEAKALAARVLAALSTRSGGKVRL